MTTTQYQSVSQPSFPPLSRLALYNSDTNGYDPVNAGSIGADPGQNVYVITHGWATGFQQIVIDYANNNDGALMMVWDTVANPAYWVNGLPAGAWMFQGTTGPNDFQVSPCGMAQAIQTIDAGAAVLVYSWLDGAATPDAAQYGNYSQSNTDMYGLIAASAIQQALVSGFGGKVHLLGHSDGSKVMTVATAALLRASPAVDVAQLTLFDSPESSTAMGQNSANFLWYYLRQVPGQRPRSGPTGTFVDSYISMFGTTLSKFRYTGPGDTSVNLQRVVDTDLLSDVLYNKDDFSDRHRYAPAWYSGTSLDTTYGGNQYGLGWSPLLYSGSIAGQLPEEETQTWTAPPTQSAQFVLGPTTAPGQTVTFTKLSDDWEKGLAGVNGSGNILFDVDFPKGASIDGFTFDYRFGTPSSDVTVTATLNGTQLFTMVGNWGGFSPRAATLNAASLSHTGVNQLVFTITNTSASEARVFIGNLCSFTIGEGT